MAEGCAAAKVKGADGAPHLTGLLDVETLRAGAGVNGVKAADSTTVATWRGSEGELAATLRAGGGGVAAGWRGDESSEIVEESREESPEGDEPSQNARIRPEEERTSYVVEAGAAPMAAQAVGAR